MVYLERPPGTLSEVPWTFHFENHWKILERIGNVKKKKKVTGNNPISWLYFRSRDNQGRGARLIRASQQTNVDDSMFYMLCPPSKTCIYSFFFSLFARKMSRRIVLFAWHQCFFLIQVLLNQGCDEDRVSSRTASGLSVTQGFLPRMSIYSGPLAVFYLDVVESGVFDIVQSRPG